MRALDRYRNPDTPATFEPTETHVRVVAMFDEMMTTMLSGNTTLSPVVRIMQRMRPAMLRDLAQVPEQQLRDFVVDLGRRMMLAGDPSLCIIDTPVTRYTIEEFAELVAPRGTIQFDSCGLCTTDRSHVNPACSEHGDPEVAASDGWDDDDMVQSGPIENRPPSA